MNILRPLNRKELREWLIDNAAVEKEVWVLCSRAKVAVPLDNGTGEMIRYVDVVEEALCFGWIDSTIKKNPNGLGCLQRISPRRKHSHWTELNKQRCRQLMEQGLMTPAGLQTLYDNHD